MSFRLCLCWLTLWWIIPTELFSETKAPLTPHACTQMRYVDQGQFTDRSALQLSHDSRHVAYVIQASNFDADTYEDQLYVTAAGGVANVRSAPIMTNSLIAAITWFPDNRHLALLMRLHGKVVLAQVDSVSGKTKVIEEAQGDITDYSMDSKGDLIAIAVKVAPRPSGIDRSLTQLREGYRLDLNSVAPPERPRRQVYILRRAPTQQWSSTVQLTFTSPFSGERLDSIADNAAMHINVSPNGRYLLIDNIEMISNALHKDTWEGSRQVHLLKHQGGITVLNYLYDLRRHTASMPLESPIVRSETWAPDSQSYVAVALAPVSSQWEERDMIKSAPSDHSTHLFSVNVQTGTINEVLERAEAPPLVWATNGDLELQDSGGMIRTFSMVSDRWEEKATFDIPLPERSPYLPIVSDGKRIVMEYENAVTAPEIIQVDRSIKRLKTIVKLDPEIDHFQLPRVERIEWKTSTGYKAKGVLLLPPDYDPTHRYPVVIENGSLLYTGNFVCDAGTAHVSSFARGILADAGIIYLIREWPGINDWKTNYYPKGFPGEIGEAEFQLDLVESAIQYLDNRQMINKDRIGLIGFSRGGWYTEYALAHSPRNFAAATATDNVRYSLGEYWSYYNEVGIHLDEGMYGGPPYGATFGNWLKYSISFNLDKIYTPLLIEVMGYGHKDDQPGRPFMNLVTHYEEFVGLKRLGRPVEAYYYPLEQHQVDHPLARISALQRNVDWYRYWLQDHERSNPEDPDQYVRWGAMRQEMSNQSKASYSGHARQR